MGISKLVSTYEEDGMPRIAPHLWFDNQAKEAAELYTSLFENSQVTDVTRVAPLAD